MNSKLITRLLLSLGLAAALYLGFVVAGPGSTVAVIVMLSVIYLIYVLVRWRIIARIGSSIRWKFLVAISVIAVLFLLVSLVNFGAMGYMHRKAHEIQEIAQFQPSQVGAALDDLNNTHHGLLFSLTPVFGLLAVLVAAGLGIALAASVIDPVRRMGQAMRRIASGDFSQPLQVENRDELGELAEQINQTADELAKLQEATVTEERARALQERIAQVTLAQEEERRRISRELHDGLGPSLATIGNQLRACQYIIHSEPGRAESELDDIINSLKGHIRDIRGLIFDLRPLTLDHMGLVGALRQEVERFGKETGVEPFFSTEEGIALDSLAEVIVLRIVHESLNNVEKHAQASRAEVSLQVVGTDLEVRVEDNGRGFDPNEVRTGTLGKGLGLLSMQERAELVAGSLSVKSSPGTGCQVILHVPLREAEVGADSHSTG